MSDEEAFKEAIYEFRLCDSDADFPYEFDDEQDFADFLETLAAREQGKYLAKDFHVSHTVLVGLVNGEVVGRLEIRHELDDWLTEFGGHIGYAVRSSAEGKGYATEMLHQAKDYARKLNLKRLLLSCEEENLASKKVIERNGAVFEGFSPAANLKHRICRYWLEL